MTKSAARRDSLLSNESEVIGSVDDETDMLAGSGKVDVIVSVVLCTSHSVSYCLCDCVFTFFMSDERTFVVSFRVITK
jgi:hypothetical protein